MFARAERFSDNRVCSDIDEDEFDALPTARVETRGDARDFFVTVPIDEYDAQLEDGSPRKPFCCFDFFFKKKPQRYTPVATDESNSAASPTSLLLPSLSSRTTFGNSQHNVHSVKEGSLFWADSAGEPGHSTVWMCLSSNGLGVAIRRLSWKAEPPVYVSQGCGFCGTLAENELGNMFAIAKAFAHQATAASYSSASGSNQQNELMVIPFENIGRITVGQRCANSNDSRNKAQQDHAVYLTLTIHEKVPQAQQERAQHSEPRSHVFVCATHQQQQYWAKSLKNILSSTASLDVAPGF